MGGKPKLNFKVSSGLKDIIGRDLITDDNIAVFELVKNSYDAHATKVKISFLNIYGSNPTIHIKDNGKGMSYVDLKTKWLFVAYSAKREGTEDKDYRSKIYQDRPFAGAKGIGRFSCDRLGKKLTLITIKDNKSTRKEILEIDWIKFERNLTDEFIEIPVNHTFSKIQSTDRHGTTLIITELRSDWNREKLKSLRKSLSKLINPEDSISNKRFEIIIDCPEEEVNDEGLEEYEKVTGEIKNFIFDDLEIRTTKIEVQFDQKGNFLTTELLDGGTLIYRIREKNTFSTKLHSITFKIYYLNKSAKDIFKRRMGVRTRDYGSIFVYKNNIRIYPYGEPNEDSFNLDKRKAQKPSVYLGNKDLIGRIEIIKNDEFKETSSRGDGFIKNEIYHEFLEFFQNIVIDRLERYVIDVQKWGGGEYLSIEDEVLGDRKAVFLDRVTHLISKISNSNEIIDFQYENDILNIIDEKQSDSAIALVNNLFKIAKSSNNSKLLRVAEKTKDRVEQLRKALEEARKIAEEKAKELEETVTENLFLKSIKSHNIEEIVSFIHHMGISAANIDLMLKDMYGKINRNEQINLNDIRQIIEDVSFENTKILSVSKFATKANFKLFTEEAEIDIINYSFEYLSNILKPINKLISFKVKNSSEIISFVKKVRPIEINILFDNLVSNSIKANADNVFVEINKKSNDDILIINFKDDGEGIKKSIEQKIFELGFTTTSGSGIGLFHVKKIMKGLNGDIKLNKNYKKGTEFFIEIKKSNI